MENQEEIWKDIQGYEGLYQVSDLGRVKSLRRSVVGDDGVKQPVFGCILKPWKNHGYNFVTLCNYDHDKKSVHRLVGDAFISNDKNKPEINHKNGKKADNRVENLEWVNHSENQIHAYRVLNKKRVHLGKFGKDHNRSKAVLQFTKSGEFIGEYGSQYEVQRKTKIGQSCISAACSGKTKSAGGFIWKIKNDTNV